MAGLPFDVDGSALKAGSVGYWLGLVAPVLVGGLVGLVAGAPVPRAVGGLVVGVFVAGGLGAGALAALSVLRPTVPDAADRRPRISAVAHGAAVAALWDVVGVFAVAVTAAQNPIADAPARDPVAAGARAALTVGIPKGLVLGATGAVVGLLLGPPLLGWD